MQTAPENRESETVRFSAEQARLANELSMRLTIWGKANPEVLFREYLSVAMVNDPELRNKSEEFLSRVYERASADRMKPIIQELLVALNALRRTKPDVFQQMIAVLVKSYPVLGSSLPGREYNPKWETQRHAEHKSNLMLLVSRCPVLFAEAYFELVRRFMPELNDASSNDQLRHFERLASKQENWRSLRETVYEGLNSWIRQDPKGCRQFRREVEFMRLSVCAAEEAGRREKRPRWVSDR
ncbi:hypothetical protein [Methyloligella halotolerans]|uniref:hypothetical protein n=1 Tax=Methyloligella halotolerans TaxID=1177755 RepID=UPI00114CD4C3|nr:hypothetical protein [Methyloligella halotolerans]